MKCHDGSNYAPDYCPFSYDGQKCLAIMHAPDGMIPSHCERDKMHALYQGAVDAYYYAEPADCPINDHRIKFLKWMLEESEASAYRRRGDRL
jgi:hypothetical protein